ncbi:TRAP transporter substrate-binding protein [uncultured Subdoligranulum sp.]|uniref:TRAP transporter substrate-binding protein n=1 Tax=uncultured Subdoligranulum sp. TaxID=512298 RepID=UPI002615E332|nr:TRAP transporter substrate-binding protein [uncultured Subdoligranulum sp.]
MTRRVRWLALAGAVLICLIALAAAVPEPRADAATGPELILRYAENQPEGYPTTEAAYAFAELVAERTDGRVNVRVYSNGVLGSETSIVEQMEYGGIDFSRISIMSLGEFVPEVFVLQLPFLYKDDDHMWRVLDGAIGEVFLDSIKDRIGLTGLAWFDAGVRHFYTNRPVKGLEDLQGLRIRVAESGLMEDLIRQLGAVPVRLSYDDVYSALAKGEIDGAENNWPSYDYSGHFEVAKYMLVDGHTRIPELLLASAEAMEKLTALDPQYPALVRDCAREAALLERDLWKQAETESEAEMREAGVTVTTLTDEEWQRFRDAVEPIYQEYTDQKALIARIQREGK